MGGTFKWEIKDFSKLTDNILQSDPFAIGEHNWRIVLYPKGVNLDNAYLSVFFAVADSASLPAGWSRAAKFRVELINLVDKAQSVKLVTPTQCKFHAGQYVLGWPKFIDLNKLRSTEGFLVEDTIMVKADIVQDQKKEELKIVVKEECEQTGVKIEEDKDSKESDGVEEEKEEEVVVVVVEGEGAGEEEEGGGEEEEEEEEEDGDGDDYALDKCLNNETEGVDKEESTVLRAVKTKEKRDEYMKIWLRKAKRRKIENKANGTKAKSLNTVHLIGFPKPCDSSFLKLDGLAGGKSNCPPKSQTPLQTYADLFDDISRVVGPSPSSLVSPRDVDAGTETVDVSLSLSLLRHVATKFFCQIPSHLRPELASALLALAQAKSLPSAQFSALSSFSNQFENLCSSYDSNIALLDTAEQFLDTKDDTFVSLKRLSKTQLEIKGSIESVGKEKDQLWCRLTELGESETRLLEDYTTIGKEATRVKAEWDAVAAKDAEMTGRQEEAENEMAAIETSWARFISHFK